MDWEQQAGFINDSIAQEPQRVVSTVQVAGEDKNKLMAAVSVSQVCKLTRPNEGLIIHGKKCYHVNLVAYVYEIVDINPQKIHLMVDDHSGGGPLEVTHIRSDVGTPGEDSSLSMFQDHTSGVGEENESRDIHSIKTGDYVRCVGVVKYTQDKANIIAYQVAIITDPNEITMHIMEVIRDSLFLQKDHTSSGVTKPIAQEQKRTHESEFGKLSTRDKHLITFLKQKAGDKGMHVDDLVKNFTAFTKTEIIDSLTMLSNEGLCWQSDDENIWCVE